MKKNETSDKPKRTSLRQTMSMAYSPGNWMMVPRHFYLIMSHNEVRLFCFFADVAERHRAELDGNRGWFYCRYKKVEDELFMATRTQTDVVSGLVKKGLISVRKRGMPPKRYVKIHWEVLNSLLDEAWEKWQEKCNANAPSDDDEENESWFDD